MNDNPPKKISLKSQSAWILSAKIIGFGFSFLLPLLVVRFLNKDEVGTYRQVFLIIINANAIFTLGFGMSAYYYLPRETSRRSAVIFNTLLFNFVMGGLVCFALGLFPSLVGSIFQSEEITRLAPKIGIVIWFWMFSSFLEIVAVANQEPKMATAFIVLTQFTKTALLVLGVMLFTSVESLVYAAMLQAMLQSIILIVYLNARFPRFWTTFDAKFFREQLFYALPFGLSGLIWTLQTDVHNYFVGYRFSAAEFAIYAIGCFQLPLIGMLGESVAAVLIPRISSLQATGDRAEIIRLTIRAAQKLSFFYFPIYIFLMITAETFITTLFTRDYTASVPIFLVNLTLLPIWIWATDPIVRAYKELGRYLLLLRLFILPVMTAVLYYGMQHFDMRGIIGIVVVTTVTEKIIFTAVITKKLNVERRDLGGLRTVGKTAAAALTAGFFTYLFYWKFAGRILLWGADWSQMIFAAPKKGLVDFFAGSSVLAFSALIFVPLYLLGANFFGIIEDEEKEKVKEILRKIFRRDVVRVSTPAFQSKNE